MAKSLPENVKVLKSLYEASEVINSIRDYNELLEKIMDITLNVLEAERGFLMILEDKKGEMKVEVARNLHKENIINSKEISMTSVYKALQDGEIVLTSDAKTDPRFSQSQSIALYNLRSILVVPLKRLNRVIGVIYLDTQTSKKIFSDEEIEFMNAFANLAVLSIENAKLTNSLAMENLSLKKEISSLYNFEDIIGTSKKMRDVLRLLEKVINSDVPVLLEGESGTGKGLIARAIHFNSPRKDKKFITQYCGALPETLLESELFGYVKGAFTGALTDKMGLFEAADGGTFFLDEVGDLSISTQTKLLRVLQEHKIRRLGDTEDRNVDVRIISATNKILEDEVKKGTFREDLFYRLKVVKIVIPPLRERKEDIPILVKYLIHKLNNKNKNIEGVSNEAMAALLKYDWPGNIRELENVIQHAIVMAQNDIITIDDIPEEILNKRIIKREFYSKKLKDVEREHILNVLAENDYSRKKTADVLGISLRTLHYKLKEYNIERKNEISEEEK
uniref:Sigma-54-dependent Fis family transcriptional regulator n=1 Tax=candidate division WOR-3 bacterium TaxID=2052148 RepID=A0A7C3J581_UNCW3